VSSNIPATHILHSSRRVPRPRVSTLFPYTTLFRSSGREPIASPPGSATTACLSLPTSGPSTHTDARSLPIAGESARWDSPAGVRSEEHTSELQSRFDLVCRLLLEKKKTVIQSIPST